MRISVKCFLVFSFHSRRSRKTSGSASARMRRADGGRLGDDERLRRPPPAGADGSGWASRKRARRQASVALPIPSGPPMSMACGSRPRRKASSNSRSAAAWPNSAWVSRGCGASAKRSLSGGASASRFTRSRSAAANVDLGPKEARFDDVPDRLGHLLLRRARVDDAAAAGLAARRCRDRPGAAPS